MVAALKMGKKALCKKTPKGLMLEDGLMAVGSKRPIAFGCGKSNCRNWPNEHQIPRITVCPTLPARHQQVEQDRASASFSLRFTRINGRGGQAFFVRQQRSIANESFFTILIAATGRRQETGTSKCEPNSIKKNIAKGLALPRCLSSPLDDKTRRPSPNSFASSIYLSFPSPPPH